MDVFSWIPPTPIAQGFDGCPGGPECKFLCKDLVRGFNEKNPDNKIKCLPHDEEKYPDDPSSADMKRGCTPTVDCDLDQNKCTWWIAVVVAIVIVVLAIIGIFVFFWLWQA
ncbi:unnamed protein product [Amoebophrya sp. A120]|nr:unnamed protein product [Amoebophrya sp. A120]|eukprot:GSA120T00009974001.1